MARWPMVERVVIAHLNAAISPARAGTKLPANVDTSTAGFVRVTRGPGSDDSITDEPLVDVEVFHPDQAKAWDLAETARQAMHDLAGRIVADALVDAVNTATSPNRVEYSPNVERYVASYRLALRQR